MYSTLEGIFRRSQPDRSPSSPQEREILALPLSQQEYSLLDDSELILAFGEGTELMIKSREEASLFTQPFCPSVAVVLDSSI